MSLWSHFPIRNAYFPCILPEVPMREVTTEHLCVRAPASLAGDLQWALG